MSSSRRAFMAAALAILLNPALALAHEGGVDARGTISEVSATEVVVRTAGGEPKRFAVTDRTEVRSGSAAGKIDDVRVGERAVVHARKTSGGAEAISIRLPRKPKRRE